MRLPLIATRGRVLGVRRSPQGNLLRAERSNFLRGMPRPRRRRTRGDVPSMQARRRTQQRPRSLRRHQSQERRHVSLRVFLLRGLSPESRGREFRRRLQ